MRVVGQNCTIRLGINVEKWGWTVVLFQNRGGCIDKISNVGGEEREKR